MDGLRIDLVIKMIFVVVWLVFSVIFWCSIMARVQNIWKQIDLYLRAFESDGPQYICAAQLSILAFIKVVSSVAMATPVGPFLWLIFDMAREFSGGGLPTGEVPTIETPSKGSFAVGQIQAIVFLASIFVMGCFFVYLWSLEMFKHGRIEKD